jgi:hypothetical protein
MKAREIKFAFFMAAIAQAGPAWAQVYKCADDKGKVTYSDAPCTGKVQSTINATPTSGYGSSGADSAPKQLPPGLEMPGSGDAAREPPRTKPAPAGVPAIPAPSGPSREQLENRIRELEIETRRAGNTKEQRIAAKRELDALSRGSALKLDAKELQRREDLYKDAGSLDKEKRRAAERALEAQTDRYESEDYLKRRAADKDRVRREEEQAQKDAPRTRSCTTVSGQIVCN